ncbi:hypothetical protein GCM10023235_24790 [Kitasatospora terrestris]|uniref:Uncharacterized protein n=1 Tax=Kitasatospora terrestris TaxID=258051 RepID=A0ABP9DLB0_9ACTN
MLEEVGAERADEGAEHGDRTCQDGFHGPELTTARAPATAHRSAVADRGGAGGALPWIGYRS